jgi:hypothetical protein
MDAERVKRAGRALKVATRTRRARGRQPRQTLLPLATPASGSAPARDLQEERGLRRDLQRGLHFAHIMLMVNQDQGNRAVASVEALVALLAAKGLIRPEELAEPLRQARQQVASAPAPQVRLAEMGDKYADQQAVEIDCASRLGLCRARCCTLRFFLTKQDLDEGVARWDYGNPYWIRQDADGYCGHSEPLTRRCAIWAMRPHTCRLYDCRNDKRIWIDFEQRPEAPLPVAMAEVALRDADGNSGAGSGV